MSASSESNASSSESSYESSSESSFGSFQSFSSETTAGPSLSEAALRELLAAIDENVRALMADGKLGVARYSAGEGGPTTDRASGLKALLEARSHYQRLLDELLARSAVSGEDAATSSMVCPPLSWELTRYVPVR